MSDILEEIIDERNILELENGVMRTVINKIDKHELFIFVDSDGRMVTNEFKVSMKELHDALN